MAKEGNGNCNFAAQFMRQTVAKKKSGVSFSFPQYAGFNDFIEGAYPTAEGVVKNYIQSSNNVVRAIGYGATNVPNWPTETTYNQTQQLHRATAPGSSGVEFDLGDSAINPSTATEKLRMEFFGNARLSTRSYVYAKLTDTPWDGGATQNSVRYYWTWSSGGSWGRIHTTTGGNEVENGVLGNVGWSYPYGLPSNELHVWNFEFDFPGDRFGVSYSGRVNTNLGRTSGGWNSVVLTDPALLNVSLRYLQLFVYGDGTGTRDQACIHAWCGTGSDAWPSGVVPA